MEQDLHTMFASDSFDNFTLTFKIPTIVSFFGKQSNQNTNSKRRNPHQSIGLIINGKLSRHIEQLIRLEQNILILKNAIAKHNRYQYPNAK